MLMCTAHPRKKDLPEFPGLTAEEEDYYALVVKAQTASILHDRPGNHKKFSKRMIKYVEPEFVASPPTSPRRRPTKPQAKRAAAPPQVETSDDDEGEEDGPPAMESRDFAEMAAFWDGEANEY